MSTHRCDACVLSALVATDSGGVALNLRSAIHFPASPLLFILAALSLALQKTHAFSDSAVIQLHEARAQIAKNGL